MIQKQRLINTFLDLVVIDSPSGNEKEIAKAVLEKLRKLGGIAEFDAYGKETTANIGLIAGGSARNAVPEKVSFGGEIRSRNLDKLEKHSSHFQEVFKMMGEKYKEAKVELVMEREFNPYLFDENHGVIKHIIKTMNKMGLKPVLEHSGGGTDVNIFNNHGIESVVVGVGTYEAHTTREYAVISQMVDTASFCEQVVRTNYNDTQNERRTNTARIT